MSDEPVPAQLHSVDNDPEVAAMVAELKARRAKKTELEAAGQFDTDPVSLMAPAIVDDPRFPPPLDPDDPLVTGEIDSGPPAKAPVVPIRKAKPNGQEPPKKPAKRPRRTLAAISGSTAQKTPLIENLLYPGAWLLVGRPKIGKSWLELQLALAMGGGTNFMDWPTPGPVGVLYIAAEDDESRMKSRLDIQCRGAAPDSIEVMLREDIKAIAGEHDEGVTFYDWLDGYLHDNPTVRLAILDTEMAILQTWHGEAEGRQTNSAIESDYKRTSAFDDIGLRRNAAIMLANHAAKRKGAEAVDFHELINRTNTAFAGVTGSMVLADLPDADLHDPKQKERVLAVRCRDLAEDQLWTIKQDTDALFTKLGPYTEVKQTEAEREIMECLKDLMDGVEDGKFVPANEIAEQIGKQRQTIKRAISRMQKAGRTVWNGYRVSVKPGSKGGCRLDKL